MTTSIRRIACFTVLAVLTASVRAQALERVQPSDAALDCAAIANEQKSLAEIIAAGDPNAPSLGKNAAGGAARVGGEVAGAAAASTGLFGKLGGLASKITGAVAQQQVEQRMGPDEAAVARAGQARERSAFLTQLAAARECRKDDPAYPGKALSAEAFTALAAGPAGGNLKPLALADIQPILAEPLAPLDVQPAFEGELRTAGRRYYISEFRVLFEVAGEVSANTRAGYLPGVNYGATRARIKYQVANPDIAALQAITDRAWADFKQRLADKGVAVEDAAAITTPGNEVYPATEPGSVPGAPVYVEENLGHTQRKYLVLAPTGMKLHRRGFAGLGAGNIGARIDWSKKKLDAVAVGVRVNVAGLETSGSGSSILHREGASVDAGAGMTVSGPPASGVASDHVDGSMLLMPKPIAIPGSFARFREVGGFDSQKSAAVRAVQVAGALAGVAANKSKLVEMEVDLDGPATTRMALQGLASFNEALAARLKAAQ